MTSPLAITSENTRDLRLAAAKHSRSWATPVASLLGAVCGLLFAELPGIRELVVATALGAASVIDLRTRQIPNWLTAGATVFAVASAGPEWRSSLLGAVAAAAAGTSFAIAARGNYGMGDVKAMAVSGAALGLVRIPNFLLAMSCIGALLILTVAAKRKRLRGETLAYGPAIALGYIVTRLLA